MKRLSYKKEQIQKIFESFNGKHILVIGDVMIDTYLQGKVNRISPEAPVPIVTIEKKERRLGGAANVALNLQALGATPILCSVIGVDYDGEQFLDLMKKQKLNPKLILKSRDRVTTNKTRIIGNNYQMLRVDEEDDYNISIKETDTLLQFISFLILTDPIDAIIFEDYDKGVITTRLIQKVVELANKKGIPTIADPKKKNFNHYKGITLFKPNLKELKEGTKSEINVNNQKDFEKAVNSLRIKLKATTALITLSERGIYTNSRLVKALIPAHIRNIADVSGAGDTVVSVAALCLACEMHPIAIASIANLAGGLVCEQVGVMPVNKEALLIETLQLPFVK
jgi:D-glycero-beta-D-manno-heptose-7-phosphate kinase